jgi:hypothetical protein
MTINRKIICILLSTVTILLLFGCTKKRTNEHVSYHSTASIPHSISSNLTIMKYVKLDKSLYNLRLMYGVATAVDIGDEASQVGYVLFAPSRNPSFVNNLNDMFMSMSVPLTIDQAKKLSSKLKVLVGNWGKEMERDGGIFYEFMITPEHEQKRLSENVILQRHVFKLSFSQLPGEKSYYYSHESLTRVKLTIGRDRYFKTIYIDNKLNLQAIIYLLDQAVKYIESKIGKEFKLPMKSDT